MSYKLSARLLFVCAFFVLLAYMIAGIIYTPIVQSDAIKGFISLNNALMGKGDNYQYEISATGVVYKKIYAWHAPGQYVVPYILGRPFNNIGYGVLLTECMALLAGSVLYIRLLRRFSIPDVVIALSMLLIFLQRFFHGVLLVYKTADVWLFFLVPALLLSLLRYHRERKRLAAWCGCLLAIALVHALGLFVKNSYAVFAGFAVLFFFLAEVWWQVSARSFSLKKIIYHALPGMMFGVLLTGAYVGFYSRGDTPMIPTGPLVEPGLRTANILIYPIITVLNAPFGFNGLLYRLPLVSMSELYNGAFSARALVVGMLLVCPALAVLYSVWLRTEFSREWKVMALAIVVFYCCVWGYFAYTGADVSNEERLIFPVILIVVPMMVYAGLRTKLAGIIAGVYFAISVIFSVSALYSLKTQYERASLVSREDVFNHFRVGKGQYFRRELIALKEVLATDQHDALLVLRTPEDFFRTGLSMPVLASGYDHYKNIEEIAMKNRQLFAAEGYRRVYFLVPVARYTHKMSRCMRLVDTKMRSYKLLCYEL